MDLYNLRDWNVGIDAWFDAGTPEVVQEAEMQLLTLL